ncbi:hypothetical protein [Ostreiculturibacter nitratireducens]|uniref:hypothetical protein n=1 Tax=Ostreiculturibacter nitratireducens TaxID=3075226 RepID=UPI0031B5E6D2
MANRSEVLSDSPEKATRRRRFLIGAGALALLAAIPGFPLLRYSDAGFIERFLRDRFPDLKMEPEELARFSRDFAAFYQEINPFSRRFFLWNARALWVYLPGGGRGLINSIWEGSYDRFETELIAAVLMGTDYLEARKDPGAVARYLYMPDPYEYGCVNPLARFD